MNPILYLNYKNSEFYDNNGFIQGIKDRIRIEEKESVLIKELNTRIYQMVLPPNINPQAFNHNIKAAEKVRKNTYKVLAPKTYRIIDYNYFNYFQKKLFSFSVRKSIQLLLRTSGRSIKKCPIVVFDAAKLINKDIIFELSKSCSYVILLSKDVTKTRKIQEYASSEFGIAPIVTNDFAFALKEADFIITSENINLPENKYKWYLDNLFIPESNDNCVNDVYFSSPWDTKLNMSVELLGSLLCQMGEKDVEVALKKNGVQVDKIMFNNTVIK